ncbi:hypothetical protein HO839_05725 [Streptococcus suis]|nr:hypothetical protein [Streptococcus suis]
MEKVNPQSSEEIVSHHKKKQKRLLAIIASIVGGLLVIAAISGFIWYNSGNISGNWRNADVEQTIFTDSGLTADTLISGLEIDRSESLADVRYALEVSGNKASLVGSVTFNKELSLQAYAELIYSEYLR